MGLLLLGSCGRGGKGDTASASRGARVAVGDFFACAVFEGSLDCRAAAPRRLDAMNEGMSAPEQQILDRMPDGAFTSVTAGYAYACALGEDGLAQCWGVDGDFVGAPVPPDAALSEVAASAWYGACGLDADGALQCWPNPALDVAVGADLLELDGLSGLSYGYANLCVLDADGWARCSANYALSGGFQRLAAGGDRVCGITDEGEVLCWSDDAAEGPTTPLGVSSGPWTALAVGPTDVCGLYISGEIFCARLEDPGSYDDADDALVPPEGTWVDLGLSRTGELRVGCALDETGEMVCFGDDRGTGLVDEGYASGTEESDADADTDADSDSDSDSDTDTDVDADVEPEGEPRFTVVWDHDSVALRIDNGVSDYWFGLAEVPVEWDCSPWCWTGEDCVYGFEGTAWCHDASPEGVDLAYGASPTSVNEGVDTVFYDPMFAGQVAYFVEDDSSGACWIGGASPVYYADLGCETVDFVEVVE